MRFLIVTLSLLMLTPSYACRSCFKKLNSYAGFGLGYAYNQVNLTQAGLQNTLIGSLAFVNDSSFRKGSLDYNVALGYVLPNYIRTELAYDFIDNSRKNQPVNVINGGVNTTATVRFNHFSHVLMLNVYGDFWQLDYCENVVPYVGLGIGGYLNRGSATIFGFTGEGKDNSSGFAWNALGGMRIVMGDSFGLNLGVKYMDLANSYFTTFNPQVVRFHGDVNSIVGFVQLQYAGML